MRNHSSAILFRIERNGYRPYGLYTSLGAGLAWNDVADHAQDRSGMFALATVGFFSKELGRYGLRLRAEYRVTLDNYDRSPLDQAFALSVVVPLRSK
jgi:hypothetical protein